MFPVSTQQSNVLLLNQRRTAVKVEVQNSTKTGFNDLTNYTVNNRTFNFVQSVTISDDVNQPTATAELTFMRNMFFYNLSPLMAGSLLNVSGTLLDLNRQVRISVADVPVNYVPQSTDYVQIFYGRIYETDWGSDTTFTVQCADMFSELQSFWIERLFQIGDPSNPGTLRQVELAMADCINFAVSDTGYTPFLNAVFTPSSPGWSLPFYQQQSMSVGTAITNLAQQLGWIVRQQWDTGTSAWRLKFYDPTRGNTTATWTFQKGQVLNYSKVGVHLGDIRNVVHVTYRDSSLNFADQRARAVDATSIALYGRQFMQIAMESSLQVNSYAVASQMALNALSDLAQPKIDHVVEVPLFWPAQVADVYTFKADGSHYDSDQTLGLVSYKHTITKDKARTQLAMRGKPSGGVRVWFDRAYNRTMKQLGAYNSSPTSDFGVNVIPNPSLSQFSNQ